MAHTSLRGQFLLDGGNLAGSCFHRTVVLVCEHTPEGAFGIVLNKAEGRTVGDVLEGALSEQLKTATLFNGGPVDPSALTYLHTDALLLNPNVMPGLSRGHSLEELADLGTSWSPSQQLKVFAGYAGWAEGQLDDEMRRKAWLTHPASLALVFHPEPETLWRRVLLAKGPSYRLLADSPEDPERN
jgi:putative transcriptional regulator